MGRVVKSLILVLSLMAYSPVFASCVDRYMADCGEFKILSTVCGFFDLKGRPTGGTENLSALFELGKVSVTAKVFNDVAVYNIQLNDDRTVVVNFHSETLKDLKSLSTYTTYDVIRGEQTTPRSCKAIRPSTPDQPDVADP